MDKFPRRYLAATATAAMSAAAAAAAAAWTGHFPLAAYYLPPVAMFVFSAAYGVGFGNIEGFFHFTFSTAKNILYFIGFNPYLIIIYSYIFSLSKLKYVSVHL